jgi:hypothetical protein
MTLFRIVGAVAVLIPTAFGLFLLLASADRLFRCVRWLPLPQKGTLLYTALLTFWRAIGAFALLFALFLGYMTFFRS